MFGIHKTICEALRKTKSVLEAIDLLHKVIHDAAKGTATRKEDDTWITGMALYHSFSDSPLTRH